VFHSVFVPPLCNNIFSLNLLSALLSSFLNLYVSITATVQIWHQNKTSKYHIENRRHNLTRNKKKKHKPWFLAGGKSAFTLPVLCILYLCYSHALLWPCHAAILLKVTEPGHEKCMITPKNCKASKKDIKSTKHSISCSFWKTWQYLNRTVDTQYFNNKIYFYLHKNKTIKDCNGQFSAKPHSYTLMK